MADADSIRARLRTVFATAVVEPREIDCPTCGGTGRIGQGRRTITQTDVAEAIGTTRTGVSTFLAGRQGFTMDVTLRLLDWLAEQERLAISTDQPASTEVGEDG